MTNELRSIPRQILEQQATLPKPEGLLNVTSVFQNTSNMLMGAFSKLETEKAAIKGLESGQANFDQPKKLAPGVTKATEAFNKSFLTAQTQYAYANIAKTLSDYAFDVTRAENIGPDSLNQYNALASNAIRGAIDGVNPESKVQLGVELLNKNNTLQSAVMNSMEVQLQKDRQAAFKTSFDTVLSDVKEMTALGEMESAKAKLYSAENLIDEYKNLNVIDEFQAKSFMDSVETAYKTGVAVHDYKVARSNNQSDDFLKNFAINQPKDYTNQQYLSALSALLSEDNLFNSAESQYNNRSYNEGLNRIAGTMVPEINDYSDVSEYKDKTNNLQYLDLFKELTIKLNSENNKQKKIREFYDLMEVNPSAAKRLGREINDAAYKFALENYQQKLAEETGNPNVGLSLLDKVNAVKNWSVPPTALNEEIDENLRHGDINRSMLGLLGYSSLKEVKKTQGNQAPLLGMSNDSILLAETLLNRVSNVNPNDLEKDKIIDKTREEFFSVKPSEMVSAQDAFDRQYGLQNTETRLDLEAKFNEAFKKGFFGKNPSVYNPEILNEFYDTCKLNVGLNKGDINAAIRAAQIQISGIYSYDPYALDKNKLYPNSITKSIPHAEDGYWVYNQMLLGLKKIENNYQRISELAPKIPELIEQKEKIENQIRSIQDKDFDSLADQYVFKHKNKDVEALNQPNYGKLYEGAISLPREAPGGLETDEFANLTLEQLQVKLQETISDLKLATTPTEDGAFSEFRLPYDFPQSWTEEDLYNKPLAGNGKNIYAIVKGQQRKIGFITDKGSAQTRSGRLRVYPVYKDNVALKGWFTSGIEYENQIYDPATDINYQGLELDYFENFLPNFSKELARKNFKDSVNYSANKYARLMARKSQSEVLQNQINFDENGNKRTFTDRRKEFDKISKKIKDNITMQLLAERVPELLTDDEKMNLGSTE